MGVQVLEFSYSVANLSSPGAVPIDLPLPACTISQIDVYIGANMSGGAATFNLRFNGVDMFTGSSRWIIPDGADHFSKSGLSQVGVRGDYLNLVLEEISGGTVVAPIMVYVTIDDGQSITAAEIHAATGKTTPVDADELGIADSAASFVLKKLTWANLKATLKTYFDTLYPAETASTLGATINAASAATPNNADLVATVDTSVVKKITWTNVKAFLKTYFDSLYQPVDSDLTTIAGLTATTDSFLQAKSSAWAARTIAQVKTDLSLSGTNTGDQTTVSGNAGTATALQTARNIDGQSFDGTANITVIAPGTHAASSKATPVDADEVPLVDSAASNVLKKLTWANLKATLKTYFDTLYLATGLIDDTAYDSTSWNGDTTHAPSKNAVRDKIEALILAGGSYTDEQAQDAIGAMIDSSLTYVDATPLLQRAALTGDVTASAGSNATTIANDAVTTAKILNAAVTLAKIANAAANSKLLGSGASGSGSPYAEITLGTNLSMSGTTLNATGGGGGLTYTEVTGTSQSAAVANGYIANNASLVTVTLPSTAAVGDVVEVIGSGAGGWKIAQNASQEIKWMAGGVDGSNETTAGTGGHLDSTDRYDTVRLQCIGTNNTWTVIWAKGNLSLT